MHQPEVPSSAEFVFDPDAPAFVADPFPTYAYLREHAPVYRWERGRGFLVSRSADVAQLLRDRRFSTCPRDWLHAAPAPTEGPLAELFAFSEVSLTTASPGDHLRLRRLVTPAFSPVAVARMRARVRSIADATLADALADASEHDTLDVRRGFAARLPIRVISSLLDIPAEHDAEFRAFARAKLAIVPWTSPEQLVEHATVVNRGRLRLLEIIEERRAHLGDDLLSDLIRAEESGDRLSGDELVALIGVLVIAGADTTVHALCFAVLDLLRHPEARRAVLEDRSLVRNAIEESLRHEPFGKLGSIPRYALEDVEIHGVRIGKGEMVVPVIPGTLRDPSVYPDPDVFDIRRESSGVPVFGVGPHACLGATLARLELDGALETLLDRFPRMELIDKVPVFRPNPQMRDMESLRVALHGHLDPS
jgi:cytochrome P450 enzyme